MKFSVGDKIRVKRSGEEGLITSIIDATMAEVEISGTVFPIYLDEIEHPYLHWFTQKNKEQKKRVLREQIPVEPIPLESKTKEPSGVHLLFMPVFHTIDMEDRVQRFKIFVVNHTHLTIHFGYQVRLNEQLIFSHSVLLHPFSDIYLHYIDWEQMAAVPRLEWQSEEQSNKHYEVKSGVLKIKPAKLFEHVNQLLLSNTATFQYTLFKDFDELKVDKNQFIAPSFIPKTKHIIRSVKDIPKYSLDLHIEQILPNTKGLNNAEILTLQLAELQQYLNIALRHKQDKMVIIHGNGKGILRSEVHRILKMQYFVERIESGWQAGYGFGATIVYFKY